MDNLDPEHTVAPKEKLDRLKQDEPQQKGYRIPYYYRCGDAPPQEQMSGLSMKEAIKPKPALVTTEKRRLLRVLRIFFQGLRLITGGLQKEIAELEEELNEAGKQPADKNTQQS